MVDRGISYLSNPSPPNYLKALDCFHKAKNLWQLEETAEGFILSLINIAQVYNALGMHIAAKYYALCGVWAAFHFGNQATFKRISDSYAMVFHADFKQGAWISALDDFHEYIRARIEFKADELDMQDDSIFGKTLVDLSSILAASPKLHPDMSAFIDYQKKSLGWLYTNYLQVMDEELGREFADLKVFEKVLQGKVSGIPLSDVGSWRTLSFNALGIEWQIIFENTAFLNAISEEFCALLQIVLCEIGLLGIDLHLLQMPVTVYITQGKDHKSWIVQRPSHEESIWDLSIPFLDTKDGKEISLHYAYLGTNIKILLSHLSVLPTREFDDIFVQLYEKQKLGEKGLVVNTYQKVYFSLLSEKDFNQARRSDFQPVPPSEKQVIQSNFLPLFDNISERYDREESLRRISQRYENMQKKLTVSLSKWAPQEEFKQLIHELRANGWLDWQILMAIMNYVLSAKVERFMESIAERDPLKRQKIFDTEFHRLVNLEEKDCYMEIPISWLRTELFDFYMRKVPTDTLGSFNLQNGMKHPNFAAVLLFLNNKFKFNIDDEAKNNPLKNI